MTIYQTLKKKKETENINCYREKDLAANKIDDKCIEEELKITKVKHFHTLLCIHLSYLLYSVRISKLLHGGSGAILINHLISKL